MGDAVAGRRANGPAAVKGESVSSRRGRLATPGEEERMVHHDGVGVGEMVACCRVELIEFALIRQLHLQDLFSQAANQSRIRTVAP